MVVLYVILGILLFLLLLTLIPVRFEIAFRQEFSLTLRYLFLAFPIMPGKEKEEKPKEEPKETEPKSGSGGLERIKALLKQEGFLGFLKALFELVKMLLSSSKRIVSRIKWKKFDLYLCLAGKEDAAAAAIQYGQLSGAMYSACGALFGLTRCRKPAVTIDLDYQSEENRVDFSAKLSILPLFVLKEGASLLIHSLPFLKKFVSAGGQKQKERISLTRKQGNEQ